jgi:hypothetical protein
LLKMMVIEGICLKVYALDYLMLILVEEVNDHVVAHSVG